MKERIRVRARELGFDACGFARAGTPSTAAQFNRWLESGFQGELGYLARHASKRTDPGQVLPGVKTIITAAASYHHLRQPGAGPATGASGLVARYARFDDYHVLLGRQLERLADSIKQWTGPGTRTLWYVDTGPVLERDWAQVSGIGFIGKHTNLISRRLGNWIFLGEILTTLELEPDAGEHNHCGSCTRCITACPTQAIRAPFQLDARRCISYLTIELKGAIPAELRPAIGNRLFGCDDCLAACPWNRFAREGHLMRNSARPDLAQLDLAEILELDEAAFRRRFAGTPLERLKLRRLKRNACVVMGNSGAAKYLPALERVSREPDFLIAEHAAWGCQRIRPAAP